MAPNYSTTNSDQIIKSDNVNNALEVKEMVNGLDPDNNPHDRKIYEEARRKLIGHFEDQANPNGTPYVYFDSVGKRTVGIGFNMDDGSARIEWQKAFSALPENERPDFDAVLVKKIPLTQKQIDVLFNYSVKEREESLIKQFGKAVWEWLTPSERLSIESLRYNGKFVWSKTNSEDSTEERRKRHCFTGEHTKFTKNLRKYVEHKQEGNLELAQLYLDHSLWQVLYGSNSKQENGLQDRRNAEALLSNTYDRRIVKLRGADQIDKEIFDCLNNQIRNTLDEIKNKYQVSHAEFAPHLELVADSHARLHESLILQNTGKRHYFNDRYLIEQMSYEFAFNYNVYFAGICDSTADRMCTALEKAAACGKPLSALEEIAMIDYQKLKVKSSRMFDWLCNSWNGQLTEYRHSATGITHYIWRTCGDERVRSTHGARDGQIFSWNNIPIDGHPGQAYNCRCWAEPVAAERFYQAQ